MKISLAQLNYHIGNFEENFEKMSKAVEEAKLQGSDLVCFSELATCGYPPRDFLEFDDFIELSMRTVEKLKMLTDDIAIVVGAPSKNPNPEGKDLFNSAFFLWQKEILHVHHKSLLPTYDVFDEYRYFEPAEAFKIVTFKDKKIALTVCEDIWNIGNENPLYTVCPLDELMPYQPDFVVNLSASPFSYNHPEARRKILRDNVDRYGLPIFYCNHVGAQTELIFDGGSMVMSPDGHLFDQMPFFEEAVRTYDIEAVTRGGRKVDDLPEKYTLIHEALVLGVRDYFGKLGFSSAILGLSGGIDSAVTAAIAAEALGPDKVHVILMPSPYSSDHSIDDALTLAKNYGMPHDTIPINNPFESFLKLLEPSFHGRDADVTEENIQARIRGLIVMALSNKFGHILLNTSNKSEAAVGYGTLYGDMCGGLSVLGDLYKTEVFDLAEYINKTEERIPRNIITKPPSAELKPDQKDTDSLPEYEVLDPILYKYIEQRMDPQDIIAAGHDEALVRRVLRLVNINEFKRFQTPPILRVSKKAFGMGRRMPIVGKYLS